MNIISRNFILEDTLKERIIKDFNFLEEFSNKEITLKIESEKDCFKLKIFFDIDGCNCISETRASNLKDGIFRLKNKAKKIIFSNQKKLKHSESIRKLAIDNNTKKEYEFNYINLYSIDKPIGEKDAKNFMLENRLDEIMFENIDKNNSLCIIKKEKMNFNLYITNYFIN